MNDEDRARLLATFESMRIHGSCVSQALRVLLEKCKALGVGDEYELAVLQNDAEELLTIALGSQSSLEQITAKVVENIELAGSQRQN